MRKIASRLGVTATTIYNYYASRMTLLLPPHPGFELLFESIASTIRQRKIPMKTVRVVGEYLRFGIP